MAAAVYAFVAITFFFGVFTVFPSSSAAHRSEYIAHITFYVFEVLIFGGVFLEYLWLAHIIRSSPAVADLRLVRSHMPTNICPLAFALVGLGFSLFYGLKAFDIFEVDRANKPRAWKFHQFWLNFVGSAAGWVILWIVIQRLRLLLDSPE